MSARTMGTRGLLLALLLSGCIPARPAVPMPAPRASAWLDRLYFGRNIQGRHGVSDEAWTSFLHQIVTPRFPDGYTVLQGEGRWRGADSTEVERSFVLEVVHPGDSTADARMLEIAREYRARFRQDAVLRVRLPVDSLMLIKL